MRFLFFITMFFVFVSNANSQLPTKLKYDELIYSFDSTTVLIRKGPLSSVYNLKSKSYEIAPTKSTLINFPKSNIYAEISPKIDLLSIHFLVDGKFIQVFGSFDSCYIGLATPEEGKNYYDYNGEFFEQEIDGELLSQIEYRLKWTKYEIIKCAGGNYILNHYFDGEMTQEYTYVDEQTGATVVDVYRNESVSSSGVFNSELKEWMMEPSYKRCYHHNGYVFCLNEDWVEGNLEGDIFTSGSYNYSYDVFQFVENSAKNILKSSSKIDMDLLTKIFNVDMLEPCDDQIHFITKKEGKYGFMNFQLFDQIQTTQPDFACFEILEPSEDFVLFSDVYQKLIVVNLDSINKVSLYHLVSRELNNKGNEELFCLANDPSMVGYYSLEHDLGGPEFVINQSMFYKMEQNEKYYTLYDSVEKINGPANFSLDWINDSIIVVNNFLPEHQGPTIESIEYPGEDSIDANGNSVYWPPTPGYDWSGVYNVSSGKWMIEPMYRSIRASANGYLLEKISYNSNDLLDRIDYSIADKNGQIQESGLLYDDVVKNPDYIIYLIDARYKVDSVFEAPGGIQRHMKNENRDKIYYARIGKALAVYEPLNENRNLNADLKCDAMEFVHDNPDVGFRFWLSNDSIHIDTQYEKRAVSRDGGKIIYHQADMFMYGAFGERLTSYEMWLIEKGDTSFFGNVSEGIIMTYTRASIEIQGEYLIVNDCSNTDFDYMYYPEILPGNKIESENSSVWKFENGAWSKFSPYYASIVKIPGGYIASSGSISFVSEFGDIPELAEYTKTSGRYFFLDSNLNVVPYMDWFDFPLIQDLGFGLKVCYDNSGCFFMTYNRVAVTNAEWDDFELFGKKLKAIKNEVPMIDEYGEQVYDENGVQVMASESVIMFFKIP